MKNKSRKARKSLLLSLLFTFSIIIPINVNAQTDNSELANDSTVYDIIEQMPTFPEGQKEMIEYINKSQVYPETAKEKGDQGTVITQFVVEKNGSISNISIIRGISSELDAEALRIIKHMPQWTPGILNDKPVRVKYTLPIPFKLTESKTLYIGDKNISPSQEVVVDKPDKTPEFPGGQQALMRFLSQNMKYPQEAREMGVQGRVIVKCIVNSSGKTEEAIVVRSVHPLLDAEALRVINLISQWEPATKDGKEVKASYVVPLMFRLGHNTKKKK